MRTLLCLALLPVLSACVPTRGDISFLWSFDGEPSCGAARVAELDLFLVDEFDRIVFSDTVTCAGAGLTLLDFRRGDYTLFIDAYSTRGLLIFEGARDFFLAGGVTNDLGTIQLSRVGGDATGDLTFRWSFDGEPRCSRAGVSEVDVRVLDDATGDTLLIETADCVGEGLFLLDLPPVRVELILDAYDGRNNLLYAGSTTARVREGVIVDIGVVDLAPAP